MSKTLPLQHHIDISSLYTPEAQGRGGSRVGEEEGGEGSAEGGRRG